MATDPVEILNQRNAEVAKIHGYVDLTEDAKARRIAEVNKRAQREYQQALADQEREIRERVENAEKKVFATPYPRGTSDVEQAQLRALRRGAYESVYHSLSSLEPGETREELERLLEHAGRTGDTELAAAVYHVATERGERSVANSYLEKRPTEKRRWEEYVEARTEANSLDRMFARALTDKAMQAAGLEGDLYDRTG